MTTTSHKVHTHFDSRGNSPESSPLETAKAIATNAGEPLKAVPFKATQNQIEVANAVVKAADRRETTAIIGNAGTGKTVTIAELVIPLLLSHRQKIVATAFTHRACGVLKEKLRKAGYGRVEVMTLACLLGFCETGTDKGGKPIFSKWSDSKFEMFGFTTVIVDEASMVDSAYTEALSEECVGLIFVGDDAQLAPVKHADHLPAPAFQLPESAIHRLYQVHRNAGPILELANQIRVAPAGKLPDLVSKQASSGEVIVHHDREQFTEAICKAAAEESDNGTADQFRVLAYTNAAVREWNQVCRQEVVGASAPAYYMGEKLISRNGIFDLKHVFGLAHPKRGASTELTICSEPAEETFDLTRAYALRKLLHNGGNPELWSFKARCEATGEVLSLYATDPADHNDVEDLIRECWKRAHLAKKSKKPVEGFDNKEWAFSGRALTRLLGHYVQPRYALTVHKSQGGEWPSVFVDLPNFAMVKGRAPNQYRQLAYTATTRSSRFLHLLEG